jgi:hypothetical protein
LRRRGRLVDEVGAATCLTSNSSPARMHHCGRAKEPAQPDKRDCRKVAYSANRLGPVPAAPLLSS